MRNSVSVTNVILTFSYFFSVFMFSMVVSVDGGFLEKLMVADGGWMRLLWLKNMVNSLLSGIKST